MKHEQLTPQETMYDHGVELAHEANAAFDREHDASAKLDAMIVAEQIPGVEVSEAAKRGVWKESDNAKKEFNQFSDAVGSLIGPKVFDKPEAGKTAETSTKTKKEVVLTPEQQAKVEKTTIAMSEKFGVDKSEFSVVKAAGEDGKESLTLMHTAGNGLYKGSWNKIMDKKATKDFTIEVDGVPVDTRQGMTYAAYDAFIADVKANGADPLPDSRELSDQNHEPWTWTLMTGEAVGRGAPFASVYEGQVYRRWVNRDRDNQVVRFRPAVVI